MREKIHNSLIGWTLVEILVTCGILTIIISGIFTILNVSDITWRADSGLLDLQQDVRRAMDGMIREARQSRPLDITNSLVKLDFYIPDVSNLISYYVLNNQLIREHPAGIKKVLANNITSLDFCCSGGADCADCSHAHILQIQIQAAKTAGKRQVSFTLKEQARLRNE